MAASMCNVFRRVSFCRKQACWTKSHRVLYSGEVDFRKRDDANRDFRLQAFRKKPKGFAAMFRQSQLAQMGDLKDKLIYGTVETVRGDDLYIDFGGKFNCVCPRPARHGELYKKGTVVRLLVHDLEMTSSFLGSDKHVTLLEADATLLGLKGVHQRKIRPQDETPEEETGDVGLGVTAESIADKLMAAKERDSFSDGEAIVESVADKLMSSTDSTSDRDVIVKNVVDKLMTSKDKDSTTDGDMSGESVIEKLTRSSDKDSVSDESSGRKPPTDLAKTNKQKITDKQTES